MDASEIRNDISIERHHVAGRTGIAAYTHRFEYGESSLLVGRIVDHPHGFFATTDPLDGAPNGLKDDDVSALEARTRAPTPERSNSAISLC
jgi:hypothetical protein